MHFLAQAATPSSSYRLLGIPAFSCDFSSVPSPDQTAPTVMFTLFGQKFAGPGLDFTWLSVAKSEVSIAKTSS